MASKLSMIKVSEVELSLLTSAVEQVQVQGRDCLIVASALKKLDRAKEKFLDGKVKDEEMIPISEIMGNKNGAQMQKTK